MVSQVRWGRSEDKKYKGAGIYMFISPSGKRYIGQSKNVRRRITHGHPSDIKQKKPNGEYKSTTHWARAARKYGWGKMKVFILQRFHPDESNLHDVMNTWEKHWIKWFKSDNREFGYNANEGGGSCVASAETRAKISAAIKGEKNGFYGKKHSTETRAKISLARKGRKPSAETRAKVSAKLKGRKFSAETRKKISDAQKGKKNHNYGKKASAQTRAKMSAASKVKKAVIATFPTGEQKKFQSITDAAEKLSTETVKFHSGNISKCCLKKRKTHKGYKFKYAS